MSAKSNSINKMSEEFIKEKAHVIEDDTIELIIQDVDIYPVKDKPTIHLHCGFPLEDYFVRIELENFPFPGYKKINSIFKENVTNINDFIGKSIKLKFIQNKKEIIYNQNAHDIETHELEMPVMINDNEDINAHICKILRYYEYNIKSDNNMDDIIKQLNNSMQKYVMLEKSINNNSGLTIQSMNECGERSFCINIGETEHSTIPIKISLPQVTKVNNHPVSDFINNFGAGKIENLESETVFVCKSEIDESIGIDTIFEEYSIRPSYPTNKKENLSWFKKLFK